MRQPCDEAVIRTGKGAFPCAEKSRPWVLVATILGSSMAFIDSTVVNVALPALQSSLHATVVDVQWVVESYGLFLSALILVGGALGLGIKDASFHTLRHTAASWAVMQGADLYSVGQLLGHKTLKMTKRYAHLSPGYMQNVAGKLDTAFKGVLPREIMLSE